MLSADYALWIHTGVQQSSCYVNWLFTMSGSTCVYRPFWVKTPHLQKGKKNPTSSAFTVRAYLLILHACMCSLTLSDPDSEETEEAEECCWGLEMDMGESALWGDTESLCCSSDPTPPPSTQGSCSDTRSLGGETTKKTHERFSNSTCFAQWVLFI